MLKKRIETVLCVLAMVPVYKPNFMFQFRVFVTLAMILAVLMSCNSKGKAKPDPGLLTDSQTSYAISLQRDSSTPENPLNPYDDVGVSHNKILGLVRQHIQVSGKDDISSIEQFIIAYYRQRKDADVSGNLNGLSDMVAAGGADLRFWIRAGKFSLALTGFLNRLVPITEKLEGGDLSSYLLQLKALESEVLEADMPERERSRLLMVTSIARYSSFYWSESLREVSRNSKSNMPFWLLKILAAKAFVCMDIIGAIIGMTEPYNPYETESTATALSAYCYNGMMGIN